MINDAPGCSIFNFRKRGSCKDTFDTASIKAQNAEHRQMPRFYRQRAAPGFWTLWKLLYKFRPHNREAYLLGRNY
jgi:hypothetical protein